MIYIQVMPLRKSLLEIQVKTNEYEAQNTWAIKLNISHGQRQISRMTTITLD